MHRAVSPSARQRAADRPVLWRELAIGLATFGFYVLVTAGGGLSRRSVARAHSRDIFDFEKTLHVDVELPLNHWLLRHSVVRVIANYEYAFTYILSAFLLLAWLYVRRPDVYRWARTSFVLLNVFGVSCFFLYPVMPPRLLPGLGFADTVTQGHTFGSWGSSAVSDANSLAAMPSLHLAWALWVSVVLGYLAGSLVTQGISFVHVMTTLFVIMATANHYLLDAVGGAVFVFASVWAAALFSRRPRARLKPERVSAADVFFLHVERPGSPQQVGGLLILEPSEYGSSPTREAVEALVRSRINQLPRFQQRLSKPSKWRRPRWIDVQDIDWSWHVTEHDLRSPDGRPGGVEALHRYVAELQATLLPRDRPLWRVVVCPGLTETRSAAVIIAHHVIADGFGTVKHAVRLLLSPEVRSMDAAVGAAMSSAQRLGATAVGLAQLATDGRPKWHPVGCDAPGRGFGTVCIPLEEVRALARRLNARVTDLVLCVIAGGLSRVIDRRTNPEASTLRVSVTLMVPRSGAGDEGNATAAAMIDVPLDERPEASRLAEIGKRSRRLRQVTRPLASRFVMDSVGEILPPVVHAWFARTVYGRRFFHAIASNMPGPTEALDLVGAPMVETYPILPLAPGAPIAVGALSVTGRLGFGISVHPAFVPDVVELQRAMTTAYDDLSAAAEFPSTPMAETSQR